MITGWMSGKRRRAELIAIGEMGGQRTERGGRKAKEVGVGNGDALERDAFEKGEDDGPRGEESTQVLRNEGKIGKLRLSLENNGIGESSTDACWCNDVAIADEELMVSQGFGMVLRAADERGGVVVMVGGEELERIFFILLVRQL